MYNKNDLPMKDVSAQVYELILEDLKDRCSYSFDPRKREKGNTIWRCYQDILDLAIYLRQIIFDRDARYVDSKNLDNKLEEPLAPMFMVIDYSKEIDNQLLLEYPDDTICRDDIAAIIKMLLAAELFPTRIRIRCDNGTLIHVVTEQPSRKDGQLDLWPDFNPKF